MFGNRMSSEIIAYLSGGEMDEDDLGYIIKCVDDINTCHDECMYFVIGYQANAVELFGCPSRQGLLPLAVYCHAFLYTTPGTMFRGTIMNPRELPYSIDAASEVLVLFADHTMQLFHTISRAVEYIEDYLAKYAVSDIDEFAVIVGKEIEFCNDEWNNVVTAGLSGEANEY